MVIDRSTIPLEMLGEPDDTECPHGIPTGMGIECWECRYEELNKDHIALEDDYAALEQENEVLNRVIRIHLAVGQDENIFETDLEQAVWKLRKEKRDLIEKVGELEVLYNKAVADVVTKSRRVIELEAENAELRKRLASETEEK